MPRVDDFAIVYQCQIGGERLARNGDALAAYDAGMDAFEAARDIELSEYSAWSDPERIAVNVDCLYREFSGAREATDIVTLFGMMAELAGFGPVTDKLDSGDLPTP